MGQEHGVSKFGVDLLLAECRLGGLPVDELTRVLSIQSNGFCAWSDYLTGCSAIADLAGGPPAMTDLVEATVVQAVPQLAAFSAAFETVAAYAAFCARAMDASAFVGLRYRMRAVDEQRALLELTPAPGWRLTPDLVAGVAGAFRAISTLFGVGSTRVEIRGTFVDGQLALTMPRASPRRRSPSIARGLNLMLAEQRAALEERVMLLEVLRAARVDWEPPSVPRNAEDRATTARRRWKLTARETEVLVLVCSGLTNKEIASTLGRSESTVELHVTSVMKKAAVGNRATLVARYYTS